MSSHTGFKTPVRLIPLDSDFVLSEKPTVLMLVGFIITAYKNTNYCI